MGERSPGASPARAKARVQQQDNTSAATAEAGAKANTHDRATVGFDRAEENAGTGIWGLQVTSEEDDEEGGAGGCGGTGSKAVSSRAFGRS